MCYPKPGPRCSSHAAYILAENRRKALYLLANSKVDDKEFEKASKKLREAELEYSITPAGLDELRKYSEKSAHSKAKYDTALALRKARMDALKVKKKEFKIRNHANNIEQYEYSQNKLSQNGDTIQNMDLNSIDITKAIEDSHSFSKKLTSSEQASLRRYSQGEYDSINTVLSNNPRSSEFDKKLALEDIANIDSALAKQPKRDSPVIVYRRHFNYNEEGHWAQNSLEEQRKIMPVGSIFEPGTFLSTSLRASNLSEMSKNRENEIYRFEIKSYSAASLNIISAQGPNESEFLLPRNAKYRVVSNDTKLTIREVKNHKDYSYDVVVFQLEEILEGDD